MGSATRKPSIVTAFRVSMGFASLNPSYICTGPAAPGRQTFKLNREMHDLRWVRENPEEFDRGLARRGLAPRADEVLALDKEWRAAETRAQEAKAQLTRV